MSKRHAHKCGGCDKQFTTPECGMPDPNSTPGIQGLCNCGEYYEMSCDGCNDDEGV